MRLRITEPEIDRKNPFLHDKLERKQCALVLTELFSSIEGPFVMSINSPWGSGKTTFIKMFRQHLLNEGFPSVYFNARETDYHDNPLITFIGEMNSVIEELKRHGFETEKARKVVKKIKKTGKDILKKTIPAAVKIASHGALDVEKGMEDTFSDFTSGVLEDQIKNYSATKEQVKRFKEQLKELVEELQKDENSIDTKLRPLVFFIDELDFCRPDYALQVLEKARHFLDVDGIVTVFGMDTEHLGQSVKTMFGQNVKEKAYLRKYIDLEYNMPADNSTVELYCEYLSAETDAARLLKGNHDPENLLAELKYTCMLMASTFSLSLRDLNIIFSSIYLVFSAYEKITRDTVALAVIVISLKMRHVKLYSQVVNRERTVLYVINEMNKVKRESNTVKGYDRFLIERRFAPLTLKKFTDEEFHSQVQSSSVASNNELVRLYKIIKENNRTDGTEPYTETLLKRIKLLDAFNFAE